MKQHIFFKARGEYNLLITAWNTRVQGTTFGFNTTLVCHLGELTSLLCLNSTDCTDRNKTHVYKVLQDLLMEGATEV